MVPDNIGFNYNISYRGQENNVMLQLVAYWLDDL